MPYLLLYLSRLWVPCLTSHWSDFLRDWVVELPTFSQILVTFLVIIFVYLPLFFPHFGYHFLHFNFRQIWGLTFHLDVATCVIFCSILQFIFIVLRLYQLILLLSMEMSFIKLHLFLIPSFPNISQYDYFSHFLMS